MKHKFRRIAERLHDAVTTSWTPDWESRLGLGQGAAVQLTAIGYTIDDVVLVNAVGLPTEQLIGAVMARVAPLVAIHIWDETQDVADPGLRNAQYERHIRGAERSNRKSALLAWRQQGSELLRRIGDEAERRRIAAKVEEDRLRPNQKALTPGVKAGGCQNGCATWPLSTMDLCNSSFLTPPKSSLP